LIEGLKRDSLPAKEKRGMIEGNGRKKYLNYFGGDFKMLYLYRPKVKK
jgi:hypothetical protein